MKIVVNRCYGGFSISIDALKELVKRNAKCIKTCTPKQYYGGEDKEYKGRYDWEKSWVSAFENYKDIGYGMMAHPSGSNIFKDGLLYSLAERTDPKTRIDKDLIEVVELLGEKASGYCAKLEIVEIPDDVQWEIDNYDGYESVEEKHRSW